MAGIWETIVGVGADVIGSPMNMLTSTISSAIGGIAWVVVLGVGVYVLFTLIIGKFQFYIGFLFGPIGLVFLPLDKGRVLSSCISMMLAGITVFAVSFAVLLVSIDVFGSAAEKLSKAAIANGDGGGYKIMFSIASILYAWIMYLVVKSSVSWGSELFGSFGFDMRSIAQGVGGVGNKASSMGNSGGGRAAGAAGGRAAGGARMAGRGAIGAVGGAAGGAKAGWKGGSSLGGSVAKGAGGGAVGLGKGSIAAARRGGGQGKKTPGSFMKGMGAAQGVSAVSDASKDILSKK